MRDPETLRDEADRERLARRDAESLLREIHAIVRHHARDDDAPNWDGSPIGLPSVVAEVIKRLESEKDDALRTAAAIEDETRDELEGLRARAETAERERETLLEWAVFRPTWPPGVEGWHFRQEHVMTFKGSETKEAAIAGVMKSAARKASPLSR